MDISDTQLSSFCMAPLVVVRWYQGVNEFREQLALGPDLKFGVHVSAMNSNGTRWNFEYTANGIGQVAF